MHDLSVDADTLRVTIGSNEPVIVLKQTTQPHHSRMARLLQRLSEQHGAKFQLERNTLASQLRLDVAVGCALRDLHW